MRIFGSWRPNNCSTNSRNGAVRLCLSAVALALLLVPVAPAQSLETVIRLPDTLGPLNGPYHLACTDDPAFPRLYVGGEGDSGGVIVAEAITCKRLVRIPTGPVKALCYVPPHGKLYVARSDSDLVEVVDCATNQVVSAVQVADTAPALQYNHLNDRLYCGGNTMSVIACAADTLVNTIPVAATCLTLDSGGNRLYAGGIGRLSAIDCSSNSVVATVALSDTVGALCFNPAPPKVYAVAGDTVYAVNASTDSIVARLHFTRLVANLAGDPARARIFCACENHWTAIDCATDTVLLDVGTGAPAFWAYDAARDRLYMTFSAIYPAVEFYDASSGQELAGVVVDGLPSGMGWCPGLDRLYCLPQRDTAYHYQSCLLTSVDCAAESVAGIVPLTMFAGQITLDTVRNRLYFLYPTSSIGCVGAVDCAQNTVTGYRIAGEMPAAICYNPNNDRLYWSTEEDETGLCAITVYDCAAESVVKVIPIGGAIWTFKFHRTLNKLFVYGDGSPYCAVTIVDCKYDTILARIPLAADHGPRTSLLVPEDNRYWYLGARDLVVVDCEGDTVVAHVTDHFGSMDDAGVARPERKIYTQYRQVIDMDNPTHVETIPWVGGSRFLYVPDQHELYSAWNYPYPTRHSDIHVLDTRSDTVDAVFTGPCQVSGMCLDRTGRYIYCAGYEDTAVFVIDTRTESVVAVINVPITAAAWEPLAVNRSTNRIYEAEYDYRPAGLIPVIRDSMPIGLEELQSAGPLPRAYQTILRQGVPLTTQESASLYDATGRVVAALRPGPNDISHVAPGVYFLRKAQAQAQTVRKLVIAR